MFSAPKRPDRLWCPLSVLFERRLKATTHHHLVPSWDRSSTVPYAVMAYTRTPLLRMMRSHGKIAVIQIKGGMGQSIDCPPFLPLFVHRSRTSHKKTVVIRLLDTPQLPAREPPKDFFFRYLELCSCACNGERN